MKHLMEYWALLALIFTLRILPDKGVRWLARFIAWLGFRVIRYRKRVALGNLRASFPEKSLEELYDILKGTYLNFALNSVEFLRQGKLKGRGAADKTHITGIEHLEKLKKEKKGALLVTAHTGNWEMLGGVLAQEGLPIVAIADHMHNRYSDKLFERLRRAVSQELYYTSDSATGLLKELERGKQLGILIDQDAGKKGVFVDFFGRKASMHKGAAYFALRARAPMFTIFSRRLEDGNYEAVIEPIEIKHEGKVTEERIGQISQEIASRLEKHILNNPEQWLWFHKRWKTRPTGEPEKKRILILQTAFLGDVVLASPIAEALKITNPAWEIDFVTTPQAASLLENNPNISNVLTYDKRESESGLRGFFRLLKKLPTGSYDAAIVPHRSIRSAALVRLSGIPVRIGFDRSAGSFLFTDVINYEDDLHEVDRNMKLLSALDRSIPGVSPRLYPSKTDVKNAKEILRKNKILNKKPLIAIAPGSIWPTKRWPSDRYRDLARMIANDGGGVVYIGGAKDSHLLSKITFNGALSVVGETTLLESTAILNECDLLITNDSAPMHFAVAVGTPVVAIFGATAPKFGFYPYNPDDIVIERELPCRPCAVHGGLKCPIGTFECMLDIGPAEVYKNVKKRLSLAK